MLYLRDDIKRKGAPVLVLISFLPAEYIWPHVTIFNEKCCLLFYLLRKHLLVHVTVILTLFQRTTFLFIVAHHE